MARRSHRGGKKRGSAAAAGPAPEVAMSDAGSSDWEIDANDKPQKKPTGTMTLEKDKDSDEEELERLVLGDRAGFRSQLFTETGDLVGDAGRSMDELSLAVIDGAGRDEDDEEFEDADDAHMFLYDESMQPHTSLAGPSLHGSSGKPGGATSSEPDPNAPAWEDSDDERLVVSLAGRTQFRKLRETEAEDVVSGTEYTRRIRQQYLRLSPHPAWAVEADKARLDRIKKRSVGGSSSLAKEEKKRQKKERAEARQARRERKAAKASGDEEEGSEEDDSEDLSSDISSDDSSDSDSDGDSNSDGEEFELLQAALPLDKFLRSTSAMAGASQLFAQGGAAGARQRRLRPEVIDIQKTRDIPTRHKYAVTSLAFHPAHNVLLSSSISSVVHLHQIAPGAYPTPNPLLTSVRVRRAGVRCTEFLVDAENTASKDSHEIVFGGRRKYFHRWDMGTGKVQRISQIHGHELEHKSMERFHLSPTGTHMAIISTNRKRGGILNILDVNTMMWVAQARQESVGGIADFQWWRNGEGITILGRDGRVGEWCLETRRFVALWRDSGSIGGTAIAMGGRDGPAALGGDRWLALGSKSGITNVYDRATLVKSGSNDIGSIEIDATPTPLRVLEQLTTPVTSIEFTPDGQLMAFASTHQRDALRLVHLPTATVYRNWPTAKTPLGRVTAVAFSRNSDYLAVANDQGKTRLWEIRR